MCSEAGGSERHSPDDVRVWKPGSGKCVIVCNQASSFQDGLGGEDPIKGVTVLDAESRGLQGMR